MAKLNVETEPGVAAMDVFLECDHEDEAFNQALAYHRGDREAAIRTLLADCSRLRRELQLASFAMGHGFTRGWKPDPEA